VDDALVQGSLTVLNLALAALVLGVRPRRPANVVATILFLGNALGAGRLALQGVGVDFLSAQAASIFDLVVTVPTWAALVVFPFLFPRRRLSPRAERALLGGAVAFVVGHWAAIAFAIAFLRDGLTFFQNSPSNFPIAVSGFTLYYVGLAVGTLLLLDTYLTAPEGSQRHQARFILVAYVLKVASILVLFATAPFRVGELRPVDTPFGLFVAWSALLLPALLAVPLAILASRLRARSKRPAPRTLAEDAFVLAFVFGGSAALYLGNNSQFNALSAEYLLVRPLLFAYGILQFQFLEVDLRARRTLLSVAFLAAIAGVFLFVAQGLDRAGVATSLVTGVAFVATLGAAFLLALPVLRAVLSPDQAGPDPRGRDLYRAALEEAVAGAEGHKTSEDRILRGLRARLQISDREHAVMEASVRTSFGKPADGLAPGALFLGRYRVESLLGEGGFARTFLARDEQVGRRVVLKAARFADASEAARVLREARFLARLQHANIVTIYDVESVGDSCFLVLEHVEQGSLADRLARGPLSLPESAAILEDVLAALEAAHAEGILHRDVKPGNILLTAQGRAKLADFGVARAPSGAGTVSGLSADGSHAGSLPYMSPEQVRGRGLDARSDLYAVAVVWHEMLTGKGYLDLRGRTEFDARLAILEEKPKLPIAGIPDGVNKLLADALAKDPAKRPASAAAMRKRLAAALAA
jgi:protein kinase-like protein